MRGLSPLPGPGEETTVSVAVGGLADARDDAEGTAAPELAAEPEAEAAGGEGAPGEDEAAAPEHAAEEREAVAAGGEGAEEGGEVAVPEQAAGDVENVSVPWRGRFAGGALSRMFLRVPSARALLALV